MRIKISETIEATLYGLRVILTQIETDPNTSPIEIRSAVHQTTAESSGFFKIHDPRILSEIEIRATHNGKSLKLYGERCDDRPPTWESVQRLHRQIVTSPERVSQIIKYFLIQQPTPTTESAHEDHL
jgi:hypothetical protein